jgi:hypothetical protein
MHTLSPNLARQARIACDQQHETARAANLREAQSQPGTIRRIIMAEDNRGAAWQAPGDPNRIRAAPLIRDEDEHGQALPAAARAMSCRIDPSRRAQ